MKSKKILACAVVAALVISSASSAVSVFAATPSNDAESKIKEALGENVTINADEEDGVSGTVTVPVFISYSYEDQNAEEQTGVVQGSASATFSYDALNDVAQFGEFTLNSDSYVFPEVSSYETEEEGKTYVNTLSWGIPTLAEDSFTATVTGTWTKEEKTATNPTDPTDPTDPGNGETIAKELWLMYSNGFNNYSILNEDGTGGPIYLTDETTYSFTAPDALENEENEFVDWILPDGSHVNPGDEITVDVSDLNAGDYKEYRIEANWKDPDGTITAYKEVCLTFFEECDEKDQDAIYIDEYKAFYKLRDVYVGVKVSYSLKDKIFVKAYDSDFTIIPKSIVPTRKGYKFNGWNTKKDGTGKTYNPGDKINADLELVENGYMTLYAMFEDEKNPGTGDGFSAVPFIAAAVVALGTASGVMIYRKKRTVSEDAE